MLKRIWSGLTGAHKFPGLHVTCLVKNHNLQVVNLLAHNNTDTDRNVDNLRYGGEWCPPVGIDSGPVYLWGYCRWQGNLYLTGCVTELRKTMRNHLIIFPLKP